MARRNRTRIFEWDFVALIMLEALLLCSSDVLHSAKHEAS